MKKSLLIAAVAAVSYSCGKSTGYTINGNIDGLKAPMVYLIDQTYTILDSAKVAGGKFTFEGAADEPTLAYIGESDYDTFVTFILENGKITIKGEYSPYNLIRAVGTPSNDGFNDFVTKRNELSEKFMVAGTDEEKAAVIDEDETFVRKIVDGNTDNYFGLMMLYDMSNALDGKEILEKLERFTPMLQNTLAGKDIRRQAEFKMRTETGQSYIDIVLPDQNGVERALSGYVGPGKYVLLDFWATWCGPCMNEIPYMIDAYDTFHGKGFEIYSVSCDEGENAESAWLNAIKTKKMNWVQVALFKSPGSSAMLDYAITVIPTNFLIAPDGKIVAKDLHGDDLKKEIAKYIE